MLIAKIRNIPGPKENKTWAKIDLPIDMRTAESALFACKRMLVEWGYTNRAVKVDTNTCVLKIMDKEILAAKVENFNLKLEWCDGEWESWEELQTSTEFDTLCKDAQGKLTRAKQWATDGGKGKGRTDPE